MNFFDKFDQITCNNGVFYVKLGVDFSQKQWSRCRKSMKFGPVVGLIPPKNTSNHRPAG